MCNNTRVIFGYLDAISDHPRLPLMPSKKPILQLSVSSDHPGGGPHDQRDVLWRQHQVIRQRQRPPADLHPRHQGQHCEPPQAALLPAAEPPGPGELAHAARPGRPHPPRAAGSVTPPYPNPTQVTVRLGEMASS